ncbi:P-loop containing nucleoside triphosphate hydrolase protein [Peziza echinospora]|nr:P-loop containing nucleoside triphosphate hydrolase protein [Peziza echinospora]
MGHTKSGSRSTSLEVKAWTDPDGLEVDVPEGARHDHAQNGSKSASSDRAGTGTGTGTSAPSMSTLKESGHIHDRSRHETPLQSCPPPPSTLKDGITTVTNTYNNNNNNTAYNNGHHNQLSLRSVQPVNVQVRQLRITAELKPDGLGAFIPSAWMGGRDSGKVETRTILEGVSADMPSGELMAIIGGSGSGKTSMLNVLAHRASTTTFRTTGTVTYNDHHTLTHTTHAYVMQQDILIPTLTVRETLLYSAELRLPSATTHAERIKVVEEVILQLGLKDCADTRIGDNEHKGCSGGEKRRCSIGVQLLANPSVLFLDEPTTGLDATSAFKLVETLKGLARRGRTIVMTIHQPRSEIWSLFDRITLLTRGNQLYSGPKADAETYFSALGFPFPEHENPADYLIDISAIDSRTAEAERESTTRVEHLISSWKRYLDKTGVGSLGSGGPIGDRKSNGSGVIADPEKAMQDASKNFVEKEIGPIPGDLDTQLHPDTAQITTTTNTNTRVPFWRQVNVLTRRTFVTTYRDPMGITGSFLEAFAMGIVNGWIFYNLNGSLAGIRSKHAALYISASLQGYLVMLYETYRLTNLDMKVFDRERGEGVVGVVEWMLSRRIARLCTEDLFVPLIFSIIMYFMIGFENDAGQFFRFFAVILVGQMLSVTFATLAVGFTRDYAKAALFGNLSFTMQSMAAGYFLQTTSMPVYVRWMRWHYALAALCSNEFTGKFYDCPYGGPDEPLCIEYRGDFILKDQLGLRENWYTIPVVIMACAALLFYISAGLLLKFWAVDINMSKPRVSSNHDKDASAGKERISTEDSKRVQRIDVELRDLGLVVEKRGIPGIRKMVEKRILDGVGTRFEAGKLNVIMGPSGSGKSSLLNQMAKRLKSSPFTRYISTGSMKFNGALPSDEVVRSLCSYVTQDDDALLSSLTVRETLRFAAGLRLPKWMSKQEKMTRAEDIILKLGLKDCADNIIGDEFVKGISGGERRRVTIAVQILTEPKILLLDEPTSGLDAFTAASIMAVLRALADEGRTIITTIHQSRAELFEQFGNVLLLAQGGKMIYSGPAVDMLPYFESSGHPCPPNTNPADFALDLVTVDLQHQEKEDSSRLRIAGLIDRARNDQSAHVHSDTTENSGSSDDTKAKIMLPAELGHMMREKAPFRIAYPILLQRSFLSFRRQPQIIIARLMQVLGFILILALFFSPLKHDYHSVQNRLGVIQQFTSLYFVGMLQNVAVYPAERDTFYKEHLDGTYSSTAFFVMYLSLEVPFEVVTSLVFAVLAVFAIGLPSSATVFFVVAFNAFAVVFAGESVGIIFNTLFSHTGFAINITSTFLSIATTMAGTMSIDMPEVLKALNYLSPLRYVLRNLAPYTLEGVAFGCGERQRLPGGRCVIADGAEALRLYGLDRDEGGVMVGGVVVAVVAYRVLAYLVLRGRMGELTFGGGGGRGRGRGRGK